MSGDFVLIREKLEQAVGILNEYKIDAWMTFVRETILSPDPSLDLIVGMDMVWQSAFIITRDNQRIAIVGQHDSETVRQIGGYTSIVPYVQGIRDDLVHALLDLNPAQLALNYSESDVAADGIDHGLMLLLQRYLVDTEMVKRFISSEKIVAALRGRKSAEEIKRLKTAIATTQAVLKEAEKFISPGKNELEIASEIQRLTESKKADLAWKMEHCPMVNAGPESPFGHGGPQEKYVVRPGMLVHVDFGVRQDSYCSDLQRIWYVRKEGESSVPEPVEKAFRAARNALLAGFEAIKPGVEGWQVDEVARQKLTEEKYPEYQHAFGHQIGRADHDGGTIMGPRWERYGQTPNGFIEAGNVFAIELGIPVAEYGYVGLEENVLVTENGAEWLSEPQTEIWLI